MSSIRNGILTKTNITITLDKEILSWVDNTRDLIPRATFINSILEKSVKKAGDKK